MGGAVLFNIVTFHFVLKQRHPLLAPSFSLPTRKDITKELVIGSAIFGLGWGLAGFCPAPALVSAVTGKVPIIVWLASVVVGMKVYKQLYS
ncbi:hypothetical protein CLOP_g15950 [Closterium sp. NIES-67]|nr:hypothetical protein CLOP_g15950 [Closterium sp. NIES-67]